MLIQSDAWLLLGAIACGACGSSTEAPAETGKDAGEPVDASLRSEVGAGEADSSIGVIDAMDAAPDAADAAILADVESDVPMSTMIAIDGTKRGRVFDGVGAISGGGGNSRLLVDYPEPYRGQILDYLFKPNYGASLQILKVEIGGDMNSTDGAEASHMHSAGDLSCSRGYEWWLMAEAKKRNKDIKLAALSWGAPGWVGGGNFWSQGMIGYLVKWLGCAKSNGLTIDYLGGWNENGWDKTWFENLHAAIASNGYATKLVGADSGFDVANDMALDPTFSGAIDVIGAHYPCVGGDGSPALECPSTAAAIATGKPLWASENGSQDYHNGTAPLARAINRGFIDGQMTAYLNWPLVAALPPSLPFMTTGLVVARQPWSVAYALGASLWATAHTTQFAQPGWLYLGGKGSGYFNDDRRNGSYVTLEAPNHADYSIIVETTTAPGPQTFTFALSGGLSGGTAHVWETNLESIDASDDFIHTADLTPQAGTFTLTLPPNRLVSITSTTGQGKGAALSPPSAFFTLPHADDFEGYAVSGQARALADQHGAFEVVACGGGRAGKCVRQMAPAPPIVWHPNAATPYTIIGDPAWSDYAVSADVMLEQSGSVELLARFGGRDYWEVGHINAYYLRVTDGGAWSIVKGDVNGGYATLTKGSAAPLGLNTWHKIALNVQGTTLTAAIDGATVGAINDSAYAAGPAGLAVGVIDGAKPAGWINAQFDNLMIAPLAPPVTVATYVIVNRNSGDVLEVQGQSVAEGAPVDQWPHNGGAHQQWQLAGDGSGAFTLINVKSAKLLDVPGGSAAPGTQLDQAAATTGGGGVNQRWQVRPTGDGYYTLLTQSGLSVGVRGASTADGAAIVQSTSTGGASEQWALMAVPVLNVTYAIANGANGLLMDVNAESTSDGALLILWTDHNGANQEWWLTSAGGFFTIHNVNSQKVVDDPNASALAGTQLVQWTGVGGTNQDWQLQPAARGRYAIVSRASGLVADIASTARGAAIVQNAPSGGAGQAWELRPVW
jgi:hypothetical protein